MTVLGQNVNPIYVFQSRLHLSQTVLPTVSSSKAFIKQIKAIQPLLSQGLFESLLSTLKHDKMNVAFRGQLLAQVLYESIV